jgi:hypothetical protein
LQVPLQGTLQQTPWAQTPLPHSEGAPHADPSDLRPQLVPLQVLGETQSAPVEQLDRHAVAPQTYGAQLRVVPGVQVPFPSQVPARVSVPAVQVGAVQTVPAWYLRQAPAPLQKPSLPQPAAPWSLHWPSGSCPSGTFRQVPAEPARLHAWHVPVHAALQQTPCAQIPEAHSPPPAHAVPLGFGPQLPLVQTLGDTQSPAPEQLARQAPAPPQA